MDGLEAVELKLSEVLEDNNNFRFDSEFFGRDAVFATNQIKSIKHSKLEDLVSDGYRVVYENTEIIDISKEDENNFCRFLQASDLQTPQILLDRIGYVSNADWERYPKGRIKTGELLIEVKGKCEKIAIVPAGFPEKTLVSGSLFKMTVNDNISREFLLIYLISKYGTALKDRLKTNLLISYINKPDLYNILVPIFSNDFQKHIETFVKLAHVQLEESKRLYAEAEALLLSELGLNNFTPSDESIAVKSFSESFGMSGRLDSEYYQLKYDEILERLRNYKGGLDTLDSKFTIINGSTPKEYVSNAIKIIKTKNVRIPLVDIESIDDCVQESNYLTQEKDLLFASMGVGSLGRISYVTEESSKLAIDSTLKSFRNKTTLDIEIPTMLFLTSKFGQELIYKYVIGSTGIISISSENINKLLIPNIDENVSRKITELVIQSIKLKEEHKRLLEEAKMAVERAIEFGESNKVQ